MKQIETNLRYNDYKVEGQYVSCRPTLLEWLRTRLRSTDPKIVYFF